MHGTTAKSDSMGCVGCNAAASSLQKESEQRDWQGWLHKRWYMLGSYVLNEYAVRGVGITLA